MVDDGPGTHLPPGVMKQAELCGYHAECNVSVTFTLVSLRLKSVSSYVASGYVASGMSLDASGRKYIPEGGICELEGLRTSRTRPCNRLWQHLIACPVYEMNAAGKDVRQLHLAGHRPKISPDGKQIALYESDGKLHVVGVDGKGDHVVAQGTYWFNWAPDSKHLVVTNWYAGSKYIQALGVVSAAGGPIVRVSLSDNADAPQSSADFSPDGQHLVYDGSDAKYDKSSYGVYKVAVVGGTAVKLASGFASSPAWSPYGNLIAYAGDNSSVDVVPASGGASSSVAPNSCDQHIGGEVHWQFGGVTIELGP